MRNNETGEFELVLGNRQLISGFFVVVILFGIFFAMGYIVGKNSAPSPRMQAEMNTANLPNLPDTRPVAAAGAVVNPPQTPAATPPADAAAAVTGQQTPPDTPAGTAAQPRPEADAAKPDATAAADPVGEPAAGTYLQVMAVRQPEAESVLRSLKEKGFPALLGPGPNGLVRVLVGPFKDTATLGKAKAELENAGFHAFVKK